MRHLTLTDGELQEASTFWGEYLRTGGEGELPSAFQYEALNDYRLRDALFFWQAGGSFPPNVGKGIGFQECRSAYEFMGPLPTDFDKVQEGTGKAMDGLTNNKDTDADDSDTGTVLVLSYVIWSILLGDWLDAQETIDEVSVLNVAYAGKKVLDGDTSGIYHRDPLVALAKTIEVLSRHSVIDPEKTLATAMDCFCVEQGSPAHDYILTMAQQPLKLSGGQDGVS